MSAVETATTAERLVRSLVSLECWYVSAGGCVGTTFKLAFGQKIPRERPLENGAHPAEFRENDGEASLLVWCDWRLDAADRPLTSSDDSQDAVVAELGRLVGRKIASVVLSPPAWDLTIAFEGGLTLRIFADHVPGDPSFDGNWDLFLEGVSLCAGPGARLRVEPRSAA